MTSKSRAYQGGSILSFVLVGVVLTGLLLVGVYAVKQRGAYVREQQAISAAEESLAGESGEVAVNDSEEAETTPVDEGAGTGNATDESSSVATDDSTSTENTTTEGAIESAPRELPNTGADQFVSVAMAAVLAFAVAAYYTSRMSAARPFDLS